MATLLEKSTSANQQRKPNTLFFPYVSFSAYRPNEEPGKVPEDANPQLLQLNKQTVVGIISDGVTLDRNPDKSYPNPSHARMAADTAVRSAGDYLSMKEREFVSEGSLKTALIIANQEVKYLNDQLGINEKTVDFLRNDYATTTLTMAALRRNGDGSHTLTWAHIADGYLWLQQNNNLACLTSIQTRNKDLLRKLREQQMGQWWDNGAWRVEYRSQMRNNKNATALINGQIVPVGFGALTGEDRALDFVESGTRRIYGDFRLLLITDGSSSIPAPRLQELLSSAIPDTVLPTIFDEAGFTCQRENIRSDDQSAVFIFPYKSSPSSRRFSSFTN